MRRSFFILLFIVSLLKAEEYTIGNGIKIPKLPLYAGGYIALDYIGQSDDYNRFRIDDIALIGYGSYDRFSYLGEFEIKNAYKKEWGKKSAEKGNSRINIERLYFDYAYSDELEFRLGKFNTPAGYWNLTPITVLRDSASNPHLAYVLYPRYTTGVQISYEDHLNDGDAYTLMIQNNHDLDDDYNNIFIKNHTLLGVEHIGEELSFKANMGYFLTTTDMKFYYFLLAAFYETRSYKISCEYGARRGESKWTVPYAFYLQGVYHMALRHDLIGRFESYKINQGAYRPKHENIGIIGYTYRPIHPIAYKVEYQLSSYSDDGRFKLSFSILF